MSVQRELAGMEKQIPFAAAAAVNDIAFQVQRAENEAMKTVFHHPRPFTQKATAVTKATKAKPSARVFLKDAQARYLAPYESGGLHATAGAGLLVPVDAKVDQYGQLPKGAIARYAGRKDVFVGKVRGISGFWQRLKGDRLKLLLRFGKNRPVQGKLHFALRAHQVVSRTAPKALQAAVAKALATARR